MQYVINKTDKVLLSQCEKSANFLFVLQFKSLIAFRGNTSYLQDIIHCISDYIY